jgi:D-alanyl-D-alanine carboxypeptidase
MGPAGAAAIDRLARDALAKNPDLPGLWIGVWDPARGFYLQAYGRAVSGGAKATVADHGRVGSVTKTFTVVAVLEQVAAGHLKLESTIEEILPDLARRYPPIARITVDQLAGMRSGIQDYANTGIVIKGVAADPTKIWTADDLIDAAMTLPLAAPGTGGYSTTNTIILGKMLERLTGKPIERIVTEVARRAGLTQSALQAPGVTKMPDPASHGYVAATGATELDAVGAVVAPGTDVTEWTVSWGQAGGGMYSTIADLGTWAGTGLGSSLLPADLAARRLVTQQIPEGDYGLGIYDWGAGWIGHTGQLIGWESLVAYNTKTGAAFVAIVNETGSFVSALDVGLQVFPDLRGMRERP